MFHIGNHTIFLRAITTGISRTSSLRRALAFAERVVEISELLSTRPLRPFQRRAHSAKADEVRARPGLHRGGSTDCSRVHTGPMVQGWSGLDRIRGLGPRAEGDR